MSQTTLIQGDCLEKLKEIHDNSIDSIVTDPPYELGFMGKSWDSTGIANDKNMWSECLRVLKPGGHLLAFSGTRTYHRMAVAIEDAGFEVRDMIEWVYGSGFPKSLNIGKAVDKLQGNERKVIGKKIDLSTGRPMSAKQAKAGNGKNINEGWDRPWRADDRHCEEMTLLTKGTSEWEGWGTALKPAHEPICMARKPLAEKTVAENVLKFGTGGINIDESRVATEDKLQVLHNDTGEKDLMGNMKGKDATGRKIEFVESGLGRFPANLIHDNSEEVRECFPETKSGGGVKKKASGTAEGIFNINRIDGEYLNGDSGNASRFFKSIIYQAKASKSERNKGCEGLEDINVSSWHFKCETCGHTYAEQKEKSGCHCENPKPIPWTGTSKNNHPTVKPIALMEYLIKMVTHKGGIVLDPFMGSGSTGVACKKNGYNFVGIEMEAEYIKIAEARIKNYTVQSNFNYLT